MRIGLTYDLRDDYLAAGYSHEETAEFDSIITVDGIDGTLQELGHQTVRIGHAKALMTRLVAGERWDLVFNICEGLHGIAREAQVPAILDVFDIPYVFSDPLVLAVTLHKGMTKTLVREGGVPTPAYHLVESKSDVARVKLAYPLFAKPVAEGTGKGITADSKIATPDALRTVCERLLEQFRQPVLVEEYLPGREFTVGLWGTGADAAVIGSMEILLRPQAEKDVYSLSNKEDMHAVDYRRCEPTEDAEARRAEEIALQAWRLLGCRDGGRIDIRSDAFGHPHFLEVNPLAGLRPNYSDLPVLAEKCGVSYRQLLDRIVNSAQQRLGGRTLSRDESARRGHSAP